ncbi:MAG: polyisoprenoid-binding protein [Bacteroidetes bacterium]|jgi:polyisoprenoid-binding protein YceI|nr:polyisoprenoid-binding protein [Bacteroidota bacterium]
MLHKTLTFSFTLLFAIAAAAVTDIENRTANASTEWEIDRAHSAINFSINHFFTPVNGTFDDYDATVIFDPENLEESMIDVEIPVTSINTKNERRDNHLQSEDFFNAEKWPNIEFTSNTIESRGDNQFVAIGELTIRDVTRDFELPFTLQGVMDHPMEDNKVVAGIVADANLMRTDYGVGVGDWAATAVVGDEVNIELNLELTTTN